MAIIGDQSPDAEFLVAEETPEIVEETDDGTGFHLVFDEFDHLAEAEAQKSTFDYALESGSPSMGARLPPIQEEEPHSEEAMSQLALQDGIADIGELLRRMDTSEGAGNSSSWLSADSLAKGAEPQAIKASSSLGEYGATKALQFCLELAREFTSFANRMERLEHKVTATANQTSRLTNLLGNSSMACFMGVGAESDDTHTEDRTKSLAAVLEAHEEARRREAFDIYAAVAAASEAAEAANLQAQNRVAELRLCLVEAARVEVAHFAEVTKEHFGKVFSDLADLRRQLRATQSLVIKEKCVPLTPCCDVEWLGDAPSTPGEISSTPLLGCYSHFSRDSPGVDGDFQVPEEGPRWKISCARDPHGRGSQRHH